MGTPSLRTVLERMDDSDSDFRYMALSDVIQQLKQGSIRADSDIQKRVRFVNL